MDERLIFHSDGQKEMASVDVCVCQHTLVCLGQCVYVCVCVCHNIILAQRKHIRFRGQIIKWHLLRGPATFASTRIAIFSPINRCHGEQGPWG